MSQTELEQRWTIFDDTTVNAFMLPGTVTEELLVVVSAKQIVKTKRSKGLWLMHISLNLGLELINL